MLFFLVLQGAVLCSSTGFELPVHYSPVSGLVVSAHIEGVGDAKLFVNFDVDNSRLIAGEQEDTIVRNLKVTHSLGNCNWEFIFDSSLVRFYQTADSVGMLAFGPKSFMAKTYRQISLTRSVLGASHASRADVPIMNIPTYPRQRHRFGFDLAHVWMDGRRSASSRDVATVFDPTAFISIFPSNIFEGTSLRVREKDGAVFAPCDKSGKINDSIGLEFATGAIVYITPDQLAYPFEYSRVDSFMDDGGVYVRRCPLAIVAWKGGIEQNVIVLGRQFINSVSRIDIDLVSGHLVVFPLGLVADDTVSDQFPQLIQSSVPIVGSPRISMSMGAPHIKLSPPRDGSFDRYGVIFRDIGGMTLFSIDTRFSASWKLYESSSHHEPIQEWEMSGKLYTSIDRLLLPDFPFLMRLHCRGRNGLTRVRIRRRADLIMLKFEPSKKVDLNDFEMPAETSRKRKSDEEEEGENTCCVCLEELDFTESSSLQATHCDHVFHKNCLVRWATKKWNCPVCRSPFKARPVHLHQGELKYVNL